MIHIVQVLHHDLLRLVVWPLFQRDTEEFISMASEGAKTGQHPSCFNHFHNTIAETTLILLLGQVCAPTE